MISVETALDRIFALVQPAQTERVALRNAAGRVLAETVSATRAQPPFDASAMDGYGVADADPSAGARYQVVGEAAAGRAWPGHLAAGQAVRIFTGAPVPEDVETVLIQEDVTRNGSEIVLGENRSSGRNIRPKGGDFDVGFTLEAPRRLGPADIGLLAAMNRAEVDVFQRPDVAILSTGDELVQLGETPRPDQIIASNGPALAAMVEEAGGKAWILPNAEDCEAALAQGFELAQGADLILTIGGASVGDHDLVAGAAERAGFQKAFHKVAVRPGKPVMAGQLGKALMIGLPGNPVSALISARIFVLPALAALSGLPSAPAPRRPGHLAEALPENGPREHYMRAEATTEGIKPLPNQDSSLLSVLARADALIVRPPYDPAKAAGDRVELVDF
ncbi:MAG: gephyrin-like molybdotransferase Glp [Pseudomonadota bacterium]